MRAVFLLFTICLSQSLWAQFDKKINLNTSAGLVVPLGPALDLEDNPYTFSNFRPGVQLALGLQYNYSKALALGVSFRYGAWFAWSNPIEDDLGENPARNNTGINLDRAQINPFFQNYSLGIDVKYKFLRRSAFNPYVYGEASYNLFAGQVPPREQQASNILFFDGGDDVAIDNNFTFFRFDAQQVEVDFGWGLGGGIGLDWRASDTFIVFVQGGYNIVYTASNPEMRQNMQFFNTNVGLRLSLFKSKSLL
jgi:hypothetical protein